MFCQRIFLLYHLLVFLFTTLSPSVSFCTSPVKMLVCSFLLACFLSLVQNWGAGQLPGKKDFSAFCLSKFVFSYCFKMTEHFFFIMMCVIFIIHWILMWTWLWLLLMCCLVMQLQMYAQNIITIIHTVNLST